MPKERPIKLACGCRIEYPDIRNLTSLVLCPLHGAAEELVIALKFIADKCNDPALAAVADAALAKAKPH